MSEQHDDALLGWQAIIVLCCIEAEPSGEHILGGYRLADDGLYVVPLKADVLHTLSPEECAAAAAWHPTGQYDKPALPLPCTLGQLREFTERAGLSCIDEESLNDVIAEYALDSDGGGSGVDASLKVGAGGTAINEPIIRIKRNALIAKYEREWPSIEDDLRHSNENDLRAAAKLQDQHGYWNETAVVRWGSERGKLPVKTQHEAPKLDPVTSWALQR